MENEDNRARVAGLTLPLYSVILVFLAGIASGQILTVGASSLPQGSAGQILQQNSKNAPITITLSDALQRAKANSPQFRVALTDYGLAREDRVIARANLLPSVSYNNQYLYTEGNGTASGRFIANNGVHEYLSLGNAHEILGPAQIADYRRTLAAEAAARARADIAARGLVVTVVQNYYGLLVTQRRYATAQQAEELARRFLTISQQLENAGEAAHADVIKSQLQLNDRARDLREAQLGMERARTSLALLLFPDFNQNFEIVDDLDQGPPLPTMEEVEQQAKKNNPELSAAMAVLREANQEVAVAVGGYFPSLVLDYFYGVDADHLAVHEPSGVRNLGYAATATLNIPIWNWGALRSRVKQSDLRRKLAQVELTFAQRKLLGDLKDFYAEAETARSELDTLRQSADLAANSQRLTTMRYQGGEATVLEVVDAQNSLTLARNAYDDGIARYRLALANLQTLTGSF